MQPNLFFQAKVTSDTTYAYTKGVVTFEITIADPLKALSTIKITVPSEVGIMSPQCIGINNI